MANNLICSRYRTLPEIVEQHREIVAKKTEEFQKILEKKIKLFERELEIYAKQCDELQYWGNIDEIHRYKKKAIRLENKLIAAMDTIDGFNMEEELFGWELSEYPLRKAVGGVLACTCTMHAYVSRYVEFLFRMRHDITDGGQASAVQKAVRRRLRLSGEL